MAFLEIGANGVKRRHPVQKNVADLLNADVDEQQGRSVKYLMTIGKLLSAIGPQFSIRRQVFPRYLATNSFRATAAEAARCGLRSHPCRPL